MSQDRKALIRIASGMPAGDPARRAILAALQKRSGGPYGGMPRVKVKTPSGRVDGYIDIDRHGGLAYAAFLWLPVGILDPANADEANGYVMVATTGNEHPDLSDYSDDELAEYVFLDPSVRGDKIQWVENKSQNWSGWDGDPEVDVKWRRERRSEKMEEGASLLQKRRAKKTAATKRYRIDKQTYVRNNGRHCPFCGYKDTEAVEADEDDMTKWTVMECPNCGAGWVDIFRLDSLDVESEPTVAPADLKVPPRPGSPMHKEL